MGEIDIECVWKDFYQAKNELTQEPSANDTSTEKTHTSMWTCLGCGKDEKKQIEGGELCCTSCGLIDTNNISDEAEWRSGMDENGKTRDPSRVGMPSDTELYSEQWGRGSIIQTNWKSSHKQRLMAKIAFQSSMNHRDRALHHAYKGFDAVQDKLSLSLGTTRVAKILYRKFNEKKLTRGAVRTGVKANCVFYACRESGYARSAQEICDAFGIPTKDMSRTVNMFREELLGDVKEKQVIISSKDVIGRLLCGLNVYDGRFKMQCLKKCDELMSCVELMGKTPKGVASAVIYLMMDGQKTKHEICAACDISIPTLNKIVGIVKDKIKSNDK